MKATRQHASHCLVIGMTIMSFTFITLPLYLILSTNESKSSGGSGSGIRFLYHPFLATGEHQLVTPSLTR
ncbi:hypothetical protein SAMN05660816_05062 [Niastella yeongjuensis]|nr:hypothetical protein SAMN05660816_05062 [Niastella yeongjuensis]